MRQPLRREAVLEQPVAATEHDGTDLAGTQFPAFVVPFGESSAESSMSPTQLAAQIRTSLDARAKDAYRRRLAEIEDDIEQASALGDTKAGPYRRMRNAASSVESYLGRSKR